MPESNETRALFLDLLRCAVHGESFDGPLSREAAPAVARLAREHSVLPLLVEAGGAPLHGYAAHARRLTISQAGRTADFLLLYAFLNERGLYPAVMKGIVLRSLYPHPEQRASTDEDLLVRPEEFPLYHSALLDYGLAPVNPDTDLGASDEVSYVDKSRGLYIEVHKNAFPPDSDIYRDLDALFAGALDRCTSVTVYGQPITTLVPTDHLLYLLCHAFKHFLLSGVGIRQVCDVGMFAERFAEEIDWASVRERCESVRIARYSAALFRIAERRLGFAMPPAFADLEVDESDMLADILTGGLYGTSDVNRAHSSRITRDAVTAQKQQRRRSGALAALFPPFSSMCAGFPYLRRFPWLLPVAWIQRVWNYLFRRRHRARANPAESVRIGRERVQLLREYGIID